MLPNAHARFKSGYPLTLRAALLGSLALHLLVFLVLPPFVTHADQRAPAPPIELVDVETVPVVPDPPKPPPRPVIPLEAIDEELAEETMPDTALDPAAPGPPPPPRPAGCAFQVYDRAPKPERIVEARYPSIAREAGIEGAVVLLVTVDERGRVVHVSVLGSDAAVLEAPALEAVRQWTFVPAEQSGNPVRARVRLHLAFRLR